MIVGAPLFLLAAAAAAIPVILHLINRQKAKDLPFSTLRFLKISVQKTRRRRRIQDLLLMLLRMAALILIALGLANLTLTNLGSLWGGGGAAAVAIVLDNSASMGAIDQGKEESKPRFDFALDAAQQIMRELKGKDKVVLFLTGGPDFPEEGRMDDTHEVVYQMLAQADVSYERADLAVKVRQARKQLVKSKLENKQIYVVTDLQEHCWETLEKLAGAAAENPEEQLGEEEREELEIPIILVDCNRAPKANQAIQRVTLEAAVPVTGLPVTVNATLFNAAKADQRRLDLYVDGVKRATSDAIEIPTEGIKDMSKPFEFRFDRGGLHRCEVRLVGNDGSPMDDRRFFSMEVDAGIPVALVKAQQHEIPYLEDTFYLHQALAPVRSGGSALQIESLTASQLANETLSKYKVIYLVNLPAPTAGLAERLATYVQNGGNLIWICGENVDPAAYNQMNTEAQGKLLPATLLDVHEPAPDSGRDSWRINFIDPKSRALNFPLPADSPFSSPLVFYQSVLIYKHVRMDVGEGSGAHVLARLEEGEPLLVERRVERGRVLMFGTSVHVGWTNFPLKPVFLPVFYRLTSELAEAEQTRHTAIAGSPIVIQFEEQNRPAYVEVVPPSGEMSRFETVDEQGRRLAEFRYPNTHEIGIYTLRMIGGPRPGQIAVSVNVDPDESNPTKISHEELEKRFSPTPLVFAEDPEDLTDTFKKLREGDSLWDKFLWGVLAILVIEGLMSNVFSPKKDDDEQLQNLPPGMRRLARQGRSPSAA